MPASSKAAPGGIVPSARKRKGPRAKAYECWFCHARLIEQVRVVSGPTPTSDEGGCSPLLPSGNSLRGAFVVRCRRPTASPSFGRQGEHMSDSPPFMSDSPPLKRPTDSCPSERSARQGPREARGHRVRHPLTFARLHQIGAASFSRPQNPTRRVEGWPANSAPLIRAVRRPADRAS